MNKNNTYVLIHSPLVGKLTWSLVADQMHQRGLDVAVPLLTDSPESKEPYWKQHAKSVSLALSTISKEQPVILVAHSGAGPLLPACAQSFANPIHAYVFVDAGIPRDGASRLDLMRLEDDGWAKQFQKHLEAGGTFPNWSSDNLRELIPNEKLRSQVVAELHPRGLDFFSEPIPVFRRWPDASSIYIRFSATYNQPLAYAQEADWQTYELEAGHFHMLVDARAVTNMIVDAVDKLN